MVSNLEYEVQYVHLYPDLRGVVGDVEARHSRPLESDLLVADLLVQLGNELHVVLPQLLLQSLLQGGHLRLGLVLLERLLLLRLLLADELKPLLEEMFLSGLLHLRQHPDDLDNLALGHKLTSQQDHMSNPPGLRKKLTVRGDRRKSSAGTETECHCTSSEAWTAAGRVSPGQRYHSWHNFLDGLPEALFRHRHYPLRL